MSHVFEPSVGGLETVSMMLALEFVARGHEVCVATQTPGTEKPGLPFRVIRRPAPLELLRLTYWSEVMFHNNISLNAAWPLLFIRRPWVIAHHTWIPKGGSLRGLKGYLKLALLGRARCISISNAIAAQAKTPSTVIPNAYNDHLFRKLDDVRRCNDLVFVGRLVSDKGVDILLKSLSRLREQGCAIPQLTIIGDGPEESKLRRMVNDLNLGSSVKFAGRMQGEQLARELNAHSIMVVPSLWNEPFGIVALEGIACGCVVAASAGGGLSDAVGPCGLTFPNGDADALADCLRELLDNPERVNELRRHADEHLARHTKELVVSSYLDVLKKAVTDNKG